MNRLKSPESSQAEQALLGLTLRNHDVLDDVVGVISDPSAFYHPRHRLIYEAMLDLSRGGEAPDIVTVVNWLEKHKMLDKAGGRVYLVELVESVASTANAVRYAEIVAEKWTLRRMIRLADELADSCRNEDATSEQLLEKAEGSLFSLRRPASAQITRVGDVITECKDRIRAYQSGQIQQSLTYTGFSDIDKFLEIAPGHLFIVGGSAGQGKTQFALQVAEYNAVRRLRPTCFTSMEMGNVALVMRMIASLGRMDKTLFKKPGSMSEADLAHFDEVAESLRDKPMWIHESSAVTPGSLRADLRRMVQKHGITLAVVDYLQLMSAFDKSIDDYTRISMCARECKLIAVELNIPVILISQLSRTHLHESRPPALHDLRGSGEIEQHADGVAFVYRGPLGRGKNAPRVERVQISKQRDGETGDVEMALIKGRWELLAKHQEVA